MATKAEIEAEALFVQRMEALLDRPAPLPQTDFERKTQTLREEHKTVFQELLFGSSLLYQPHLPRFEERLQLLAERYTERNQARITTLLEAAMGQAMDGFDAQLVLLELPCREALIDSSYQQWRTQALAEFEALGGVYKDHKTHSNCIRAMTATMVSARDRLQLSNYEEILSLLEGSKAGCLVEYGAVMSKRTRCVRGVNIMAMSDCDVCGAMTHDGDDGGDDDGDDDDGDGDGEMAVA